MDIDTFALNTEIERLFKDGVWKAPGLVSKVLLKRSDFRLVLFAMKANALFAEHKAPAAITIQTILGRIQVKAEGRTLDLPPGKLAALEANVPHDVRALEDSAFLLTLIFPDATLLNRAQS